MNIKISKLIKIFFKPKKRVYRVEVDKMTPEQIDVYVKRIADKFKKSQYKQSEIEYRFNNLGDEDIFLVSSSSDKPVNIETIPYDFKILGSDTEIYIPDRDVKHEYKN